MTYIDLSTSNINVEHICCGFSDKKCAAGYQMKKNWLEVQFQSGYVFRRLDERAKVFIEYGPSEFTWTPVSAPNMFVMGCFWVSGKYKEQGHGKALLQLAIEDARRQGRDGLVSVVGAKKFHFMSDTNWLINQGFKICDQTSSGFNLLWLDLTGMGNAPRFGPKVRNGECEIQEGIVVYYSNRCPFSEYYVNEILVETVGKRNLNLKIIKLETVEAAQSAPTPATIFSLFKDGKFVTTDLSVCLDNRFDQLVFKSK